MHKIVGYIHEETNYDEFKYLGGNRDINHAKKLLESITENGFYNVPILVNENMEIIDGQGRFEALKTLGLPVRYVVEEGASLEACRVLNMKQTNWSSIDYVKSYKESGNENYARLNTLVEKYKGSFTLVQIAKFCVGESPCVYTSNSHSICKDIENGIFELTEEQYENTILLLDYLKSFKGFIRNSKAQGRTSYLYEVLRVCFESPEIDNNRMLKRYEGYASSYLKGIATMDDALHQTGLIYNMNSRKKVDIAALYKASKR